MHFSQIFYLMYFRIFFSITVFKQLFTVVRAIWSINAKNMYNRVPTVRENLKKLGNFKISQKSGNFKITQKLETIFKNQNF